MVSALSFLVGQPREMEVDKKLMDLNKSSRIILNENRPMSRDALVMRLLMKQVYCVIVSVKQNRKLYSSI